MTPNNQTLEQKAKEAKKNGKAQAWKVALTTALGLTAGAGVAYAVIPDDDSVPVDEDLKDDVKDEDVQVVSNTATPAPNTAPPAQPAPPANGDPNNGDTPGTPGELQSIPEYVIVSHDVVTLENGSQVDMAIGFTENGTMCALLDNNMDGIADQFIEDVNNDGVFYENEVVDLASNSINVSMNHLPELEMIEPGTEEELAVVVEPEPEQPGDYDPDALDKPETDDVVINAHEGETPDYTNDADLAQDTTPEENYTPEDTSAIYDDPSVDNFIA